MKTGWLIGLGFALSGSAVAQRPPLQEQGLPPVVRQPLVEAPVPGAPRVVTPGSPATAMPGPTAPGSASPGLTSPGLTSPGLTSPGLTSPGLTGPGSGSTGAAPSGAALPGLVAPGGAAPAAPVLAEPRSRWLVAGAAKLQALDKVNAQTLALTVKVGQSATFGSLTILVKSCMVRPPDQPTDAAAFLAVTDSRADSSGFTGWMLAAEPSVSMMQHPIYDIRVTGCG